MIKPAVMAGADYFGAHRRKSSEPRLWVLMYHRILPLDDPRFALEEPGMIVQPDTFDMHLKEVQQHFDVVSLSEWVQRSEEHTSELQSRGHLVCRLLLEKKQTHTT